MKSPTPHLVGLGARSQSFRVPKRDGGAWEGGRGEGQRKRKPGERSPEDH